jgi:hypothetical protein
MATKAVSSPMIAGFPAMSAQRLLVFGGVALIAGGMIFGEIFAVFVLHQNGGKTGEALLAATKGVTAQNPEAVKQAFVSIGGLLEDRGTKVDTHVHMTDAGYLALLLALVQPFVALSAPRKKFLAKLFLLGGTLLPIGIFLIHYVGLAYSPFPVIGWASILADSAGALLIVVLTAEAWGLWRHCRGQPEAVASMNHVGTFAPGCPAERSSADPAPTWEERALLGGGTVLVLLGFLYGAWYAGKNLYEQEARERNILSFMLDAAVKTPDLSGQFVNSYGMLAAERAVQIAAHSHIIEFGLLAMLLSFVQRYVFLTAVWKRRWVVLLLLGSLILPVFVWLELRLGLVAGGIADVGGLLVVIALIGMLAGMLRYSGSVDALRGVQP